MVQSKVNLMQGDLINIKNYQHVMNFKDFKGMKYLANISERYEIGEILGEGQFGKVKVVEHKQAKVTLAMKMISK